MGVQRSFCIKTRWALAWLLIRQQEAAECVHTRAAALAGSLIALGGGWALIDCTCPRYHAAPIDPRTALAHFGSLQEGWEAGWPKIPTVFFSCQPRCISAFVGWSHALVTPGACFPCRLCPPRLASLIFLLFSDIYPFLVFSLPAPPNPVSLPSPWVHGTTQPTPPHPWSESLERINQAQCKPMKNRGISVHLVPGLRIQSTADVSPCPTSSSCFVVVSNPAPSTGSARWLEVLFMRTHRSRPLQIRNAPRTQ